MSLSPPVQTVVPFADAGLRATIPANSNNTTGRAGYDEGFPPINMVLKAAGGIPPFGQDFNGILYDLSLGLQFSQAGGSFVYDSAFATAIGGYSAGAVLLRTDGDGFWLNMTDANVTDPESVGGAAAGWVPGFVNGATPVTMTNANVTLTPLEYGRPIIVITGLLTANLNLIFPAISGQWIILNSTTGDFSITAKTAAGSGVVVKKSLSIIGDGTNIYPAASSVGVLNQNSAAAGGTADALTATFSPVPSSLATISGIPFWVRAASANATTTPTFAPNGLAAETYVKGNNLPLVAGDIPGAGAWLLQIRDATLGKWVLLNPAYGVSQGPSGSLILLGVRSASNSSEIDFTSLMSSTYDDYVVKISAAVPATNGMLLTMRMSVNNGSSFFNSANDYAHSSTGIQPNLTVSNSGSQIDSSINIGGFPGTVGLSNTASGGGWCGTVEMFNVNSTTQNKLLAVTGIAALNGPLTSTQNGMGVGIGAANGIRSAAVNAIRFLMSTGNITSGNFYLYGIKKS